MTPSEQDAVEQEKTKLLLTHELINQKIAEASARHQEPLTLRLNLTAIAAWIAVALLSMTGWFAVDWKRQQEASDKELTSLVQLFIKTTGERVVKLETISDQHERRITKTENDTTQLLRIFPPFSSISQGRSPNP